MLMAYKIFIFLLLILLLPLQVLIMVTLLLTGGFPILFAQKRTGKKGAPFLMFKFRTMRNGAQQEQSMLADLNEADGPVFKIHNDPRYTSVGKFLAHTGLDELPQLYNVLRGEMALFGPRPLPVSEAAKLKLWQQKRHEIKPGIISPWIFEGYHKQSFQAWMKSDILYVKTKTLSRDVRLAAQALQLLWVLIRREFVRG
jgi:lipopolysaccharide/colanic/teichoic acid biosynthesis glycosyltransferase